MPRERQKARRESVILPAFFEHIRPCLKDRHVLERCMAGIMFPVSCIVLLSIFRSFTKSRCRGCFADMRAILVISHSHRHLS